MRKLLIFPLLLLLLVACGAATESAPATGETPAAIQESGSGTEENTNDDNAAPSGKTSVNTGSNPEEASLIREQDHTKGADEPTVTIIEYGDFQ